MPPSGREEPSRRRAPVAAGRERAVAWAPAGPSRRPARQPAALALERGGCAQVWQVGAGAVLGGGAEAAGFGSGSLIGLVRGFGFGSAAERGGPGGGAAAGAATCAASGLAGGGFETSAAAARFDAGSGAGDGAARCLAWLEDRDRPRLRARLRARARARSGPRAAAGRSGTRRRARAAAPVRARVRRCSREGPRRRARARPRALRRDPGARRRTSPRDGRRSRAEAPRPRPRRGRRGSGGGSNVVTGAGVPGRRGAFAQTPSVATAVRSRSSSRRIVPFAAAGRTSTNSTSRGTMSSGSVCRRCWRISATRRSDPATPGTSTTNARTYWPPRWRSRMPTTPAFATARWPTRACSTSKGLNRRPPLVITSVARPRRRTEPSSSRHGKVTRQIQVSPEHGLRLLGRIPVAGEERRRPPAQRELAFAAGRELGPALVHDRDLVPWQRVSDRAAVEPVVGAVADDEAALGLAPAVLDREPPRLLERRHDVGAQEVAGRHHPAQVAGNVAAERRFAGVRERAVLGGALAEDRDLEAADQVESLLDVERPLMEDDLGAARPRAEEQEPDGERRGGVGGAPDDVAAPCIEPVLRRRARCEGGGMRMLDAVRASAGTGGGEEEGGVARRRVVGRLLARHALVATVRLVHVEHDGARRCSRGLRRRRRARRRRPSPRSSRPSPRARPATGSARTGRSPLRPSCRRASPRSRSGYCRRRPRRGRPGERRARGAARPRSPRPRRAG